MTHYYIFNYMKQDTEINLLSLPHSVEADVLVDGDGEGGSVEVRVVELTKKTDAEKDGRAIQVHIHTLGILPAHL